ncbi:GNAT family N-acetyltransferase [Streptomyces sp. HNM0663]|uniref:GNAT family N-acetyltransferase n=1 Tax=Streptomyces chengmaiensis TaxID=3040919 RepID=A0ABT6HNU2_9ACTN|nr:GNAT family N-acetyltransferase [Streptomyces chengmaiensis]MDH2390351.1 GNAT family N-acetyltransferase [Streptomyces chengmaiensis]
MIRNAIHADLDAVVRTHAEARAAYYRGHIPDELFDSPEVHARSRAAWEAAIGRGAVLCAEHGGTLAGVAAFREGEEGEGMTLTQLHVAPAHWRRGIGTALHDACVRRWQTAGVSRARLEVFERNLRAQAFYAAHGWLPHPLTPRQGNHLVLVLVLAVAAADAGTRDADGVCAAGGDGSG